MSRLVTSPWHDYRFDPGTEEEESAVEELRQRGLAVSLYLGGRGLLNPPRSQAERADAAWDDPRGAIRDPVVISGDISPADLPAPRALQEIGRRALERSAASDRYDATLGRWSVDVRPIRASREECLECHAERGTGREAALRIGDPLGVAIYLYARAAE